MNAKSLSMQESIPDEVEAPSPQPAPTPAPAAAPHPDLELIRKAGGFDVHYYCSHAGREFAPDDAIRHFLQEGEQQRFNPCRGFDVAFYLATNPDVRRL